MVGTELPGARRDADPPGPPLRVGVRSPGARIKGRVHEGRTGKGKVEGRAVPRGFGNAMAAASAAVALLLLVGAAAAAGGASGDGAAPVLPVPSQFEVAMLETLTAVREGTAQDPRHRRYDGTPGSILEALFPEGFARDEGEGADAQGRRLRASSGFSKNLGVNVPFLVGPTLAALNSSFYRYASVTPPTDVNWMSTIYNTPIQFQADVSAPPVPPPADASPLPPRSKPLHAPSPALVACGAASVGAGGRAGGSIHLPPLKWS